MLHWLKRLLKIYCDHRFDEKEVYDWNIDPRCKRCNKRLSMVARNEKFKLKPRNILKGVTIVLLLFVVSSCVTAPNYCHTYSGHSYNAYHKHLKTWKPLHKLNAKR